MTMVGVIVVVVVVVVVLLLLRLLLHDDHVSRVTENWKLQGTGPVPSSTKTLNWHSDFSSQNISIFCGNLDLLLLNVPLTAPIYLRI